MDTDKDIGCSGVYETRKCVHCGKDINRLCIICPFCGGQTVDEVIISQPVCPRCNVSLEIHCRDSEEYDLCPRCGGLWLDSDEFRKATRPSEVYREEDFRENFLRGPAKDPSGYIPCVRCGKLMNRKNFGRISGVIIDECGRHGVWLDSGELEKIRHFIADGGLDRSQDREIAQTKDELRDLALKVDQTAFTQKVMHLWNFRRWLFGG
jgi:Zn-finger nucleic acid-binding protein